MFTKSFEPKVMFGIVKNEPPSTTTLTPVTYAAALLDKYNAALAISSTSPNLSNGTGPKSDTD